ncbi:ribonuclease III [Patescibacteria group bacterium]|nr:ribonuclease III [Patescibacteria group bacterium]
MTMKFNQLDKLQTTIGYQFKNIDLLKTALTHRSALNETGVTQSYERLEYLGDAVLEMLITDYLFNTYKQSDEGYLTTARSVIVRTKSLSALAVKINLPEHLYMSRGEEAGGGRQNPSILEDSVESLMGAIYLDGDLPAVKIFFEKHVIPHAQKLLKNGQLKDSKSLLQERVQSQGLNSPAYKITKEQGPDHQKEFTVAVFINHKKISQGKGKNKQEAEQIAAQQALKLI